MALCLRKIYLVTWSFVLISLFTSTADKLWVHRNPRYLPFPMGLGNKLQIITGFGIPVDLKDDSVTFGLIMKTNYELPTNSAQFTRPEEAFEGVDMKMTRWTLYSLLKHALDRLSFDGKNCILKSICQAAFTAFEQNGLMGEILQVLFTPSSTAKEQPMELNMNEYQKAELIGRGVTEDEECNAVFPNCSTSIIDIITTLESSIIKNVFIKNE